MGTTEFGFERAWHQLDMGNYEDAVPLLQELEELGRTSATPEIEGDAAFGLSEAYAHLGDWERERVYAERALKAYITGHSHSGMVRTLAKLALHHRLHGPLHLANFYRRLLKARAGNDIETNWWIAYVEGQMLTLDGKSDAAREALEECLSLSDELEGSLRSKLQPQCLRQLASLYLFEQSDPQRARPLFERILQHAEASGNGFEILRCAFALALVSAITGDRALTRSYLATAARELERVRAKVSSPANQRLLSHLGEPLYAALASVLIDRDENRLALEVVELNRSRAVTDQFRMARAWKENPPPRADMDRYRMLEERDRQCLAEISECADGSEETNRILLERWKNALRGRQRLLHELEEKVAIGPITQATGPPSTQQRDDFTEIADLSSSEKLQGCLDAETAVIAYWMRTDALVSFIVRRSGVEAVIVPVSTESLSKRAMAYHEAMSSSASYMAGRDSLARDDEYLYSVLIAPLKASLRGLRKVYLVPSGDLWRIPLHSLGRGNCLSGQHEVAYSFSCAVLNRILQSEQATRPKRVYLGVGNPDGTLAGADEEARGPAALFDHSVVLLSSDATKGAVLENIGEATNVHFACHGYFIEEFPEFSYLQLAGSPDEDKRLEVCRISQTRLCADLVVLSACHTGRGGVLAGDEFVGFASAFLAAGAKSVVGSLWQVNNRAAVRFMDSFYSVINRRSYSQAFQFAQRELRQSGTYAHPYYWAPFVMFGSLG